MAIVGLAHGDRDNRFRIARVPRPEARRRPASPPVCPLRAVARRGMMGLPHAGLAHSGVQVPHPAAANDEEAA